MADLVGLSALDTTGILPRLLSGELPTEPQADARPHIPAVARLLLAAALPEHQVAMVRWLRRLLSTVEGGGPPINAVIASGVLPKLIRLLEGKNVDHLHFETTWALTNLTSGSAEDSASVLAAGALPHLVRLLEHSPCPDTPAQCAWALSNVTGDGAQARDLVLGEGVCEALLRMFGPGGRARGGGGGGGGGGALVKQCAWLASNLFRAKPYPPLTPTREALLPVLVRWAAEGGEAATDAAWALAYISDGGGGSVDACARHGVAAAVVPLCAPRGAPAALVTPALRVVGNFLSGSEANTDAALAAGALRAMPALLARGERGIRKEALWAISNVCAGSPAQAAQVDAEGLWPTVLNCVSDGQAAVAREAAWCVSNLLSHPAALTRGVVGMGALGALNAFLARAPPPEERDVRCVLEGLGKLLEGAAREDPHLLRAARDASEESGLGDRVMALFETGGFPSARGVLRDLGAYILDGEGGSEEGEEGR